MAAWQQAFWLCEQPAASRHMHQMRRADVFAQEFGPETATRIDREQNFGIVGYSNNPRKRWPAYQAAKMVSKVREAVTVGQTALDATVRADGSLDVEFNGPPTFGRTTGGPSMRRWRPCLIVSLGA